MNYRLPNDDAALRAMVEIAKETVRENEPMGCLTCEDLASTLLGSVWGAPSPDDFEAFAVEVEDRDIHMFLRRRTDGTLARLFFVEGEDIGDDRIAFEFIHDENQEAFMRRLERWCQFNLEDENEETFQQLVGTIERREKNAEDILATDILVIAPILAELEGACSGLRTESLRQNISDMLVALKATLQ